MNKRLRLSMALALALGSTHAFALGLGQIEVKSSLNQPLVAEIPVLVSSPGEADALSVRLASPDAFARVGLDRPTLQAANLGFEVLDDGRGHKVIRVTTPNNVSDPFLSFLLEVDWGKGKMMREYTVLLDPPSMMPIRGSAPATVASVPEPQPAYVEPLQETPPPMAEPEPAPAPASVAEAVSPQTSEAPTSAEALDAISVGSAPADSAPAYVAGTYGPVNAGDTLWSIAQNTRADASVSVNQMMLALLRANPEAFIDNNINRLKKGAVLRIPGREEATTLAAAEAAAQVREQMRAWHEMTATVPQPADSGTGTAAARAPGTTAPGTRLELTPPRGEGDASASTSGASSDGTGRELRAELARTREEATTLVQENTELKSRVAELEELQSESRRLIELKDSELAAAQQRLAMVAQEEIAGAQADDAALEPDEATADEGAQTDATEPDSSEAVADMDFEGPVTEFDDTQSALPADEVAAEPAPSTLAEPTPPVTPDAATSAPAQPSQDAGWFGFNPWMVGGGGAVLLGLVLLLLMRRGKKPATVASAAASAAPGAPAVAAYEPDEEESELIEALVQHPDDLYLHLDLLRHYFTANDAVGFEMAAESMFTHVRDDQDPAWQEACTLGRQIAPEHPLFAQSDATPAYDPDYDADSDDDAGTGAEFAELDRGTADARVDFDDGADDTDTDVDWDAGAEYSDVDDATGDVTAEFPAVDAGAGFESTPDAPAMDDFATDESYDAIDADAATTKLELARAYLDMGDAEGARGMLEEVMTEGTAAQRDEARQLLDGIA